MQWIYLAYYCFHSISISDAVCLNIREETSAKTTLFFGKVTKKAGYSWKVVIRSERFI